MWKGHWKLRRDPFLDAGSPFVSLPGHEEAVERLVQTIESGQRSAFLRGASGLGKTRVLTQALARARRPTRRLALLTSPPDGARLLGGLAEGLGARVDPTAGRALAWKALADAVRLCRWQRLHVVLAVDDSQDLLEAADRLDLERLIHLDTHPESRLTVIRSARELEDGEASGPAWGLSIRLAPLTRSESERYLVEKLEAAGRGEPTFTPRAIQRLHTKAGGNPRGLDRLASLALMAGALTGLEIVTPEVVDGASSECVGDPLAV